MRNTIATLALLLLAYPAGQAFGQVASDRSALEQILELRDRGMVLESAGSSPLGLISQAGLPLWRGFAQLAASDSTSDASAITRTADQFYEVTVKHHDWPFAWLGLGFAKLRLDALGAREVVSPHQPAGSGWLAGALYAFEQSLRNQPDFGRAIAGVAEVLLREPLGSNARRASAVLRSYAQRYPLDGPGALALARVEAADGHWGGARELIGRYRSNGGESGVAAWELAVISFGEGRPDEGSSRYTEAAAGGPAAVKLLRENLALIATPEQLRAFDQNPRSEQIAFLRGFWSEREVAEGRPEGSRLPEHFRRIRYARTHFATGASMPQFGFEQIYRDAPRGLDDRGAIYIRHGDPDERATYVGDMGTPPNESWSYFRAKGPLILHFAALGPGGYRLLNSLSALGGDLAALYESRAGLGTEFLALSARFDIEAARRKLRLTDPSIIPPEVLDRERRNTQDMIRLATSTDSDPIDLDRSWFPIAQVFGVPSSNLGQAGLLVVIALPAPADLTPVPLPGGAAGYVVRLRTTAADDSARTTLDVDSIVRLRTPRPLAKGEYLTIVRSYTLPAGMQRVRVIVADSAGAHGAVRVLSGVPAIDLSTPNLAMSDLVVGREESGVTWTSPNGNTIALQPLNAWRTTDAMSINFQVSGLPAGQPYKVRIGLADLGADSTTPPKASVEFENQASGARELVTQSLSLRGVRPGKYLLTATITSVDKVLRRERRITVAASQ